MARGTKFWIGSVALGMALAATLSCGDGQWGSEVRLRIAAADGVTTGTTLPTADPHWTFTVERACLRVDAVALTASSDANTEMADDDCFCHGDPPHCHGTCDGATASDPDTQTRHVHAVVDLLTGGDLHEPLGVPPGAYTAARLVLAAEEHEEGVDTELEHSVPPACVDLDHSVLRIEGTLRPTVGATAIPIVIDLQGVEVVTAVLDASPVVEATDELGATMQIHVDLAHLLEHADLTPVTTSPITSAVIIGGEGGAWPEIVDALVNALAEAAVYHVGLTDTLP